MKIKTRSGAKKRFKLTASGRVKHKKMNLRHILTKKSPKRKRHLRQSDILSPAEEYRAKKMLGEL